MILLQDMKVNNILKYALLYILILTVLHLCDVKFSINPCNDSDSCRLFKLKYIDDEGKSYVYTKKPCINSSLLNVEECHTINTTNSIDFLIILSFLIIFSGIMNWLITKNIHESCLMILTMYLIFIFIPNPTLHAVDSNDVKDKIYMDSVTQKGDKSLYSYEPKIVN